MSVVLVTGVTGFVGSHLAAELSRRGHRVIGSTSSGAGLRSETPGVDRKVVLRLGDEVDQSIGQGIDAVIHCAWDLRPGSERANVGGTARLADAMQHGGVAHQLFISSYSAHAAAVTEYGKDKLTVQQDMLDRGYTAARLGVTIGPGGIYQRMTEVLTRHRVIPLIDGGRGPVPIIAIADLARAVATIVERRLTGVFNLFNPEFVPLRDVLNEMLAHAQRRVLLVPMPAGLVLVPLWLARKIGLNLPVHIDNVRALRANRGFQEHSDLPAFVSPPMTLTEMVRAAAAATRGISGRGLR
jgi:nucleoside-diphosphate-sugar epimerase